MEKKVDSNFLQIMIKKQGERRNFVRPRTSAGKNYSRAFATIVLFSLGCSFLPSVPPSGINSSGYSGAAFAADDNSGGHTITSAWALYQKKSYVPSADAFESVIKSQRPNARLYYHATLANVAANRRARARQLATYIVNHFSTSTEAAYSIKIFPELKSVLEAKEAAKKSAAKTAKKEDKEEKEEAGDGELDIASLPEDFWRSLPAHVRNHLKTPAGRATLKGALKDYNKRQAKNKKVATISGTKSTKSKKKGKEKSKEKEFAAKGDFRIGQPVFTAEQIAKDGAGGIDQSVNPNCWFEASMSALAELPRGQRLLASMIRYGGPNTYVVRFPRDGVEYKITEMEMANRGIKDKSLWASLIECAQVMKFPNNRGAEGESGQESRLSVGLGCITGCKAQIIEPGSSSEQELSSFLAGAISSKNPVVCGTWGDRTLARYEPLVVGAHAYTITGFDPASKMVTIRNPHGKHSTVYYKANDPQKRKFEWVKDGVFKMHLSLFRLYFSQVCRSFI